MNKRLLTLFAVVIGLLLFGKQAYAHHGTAAYDEANPITLKGAVTEFMWGNPHSQIKFNVKDEKGNVVRWVAETFAPGTKSR
jgi:hypothetical protein